MIWRNKDGNPIRCPLCGSMECDWLDEVGGGGKVGWHRMPLAGINQEIARPMMPCAINQNTFGQVRPVLMMPADRDFVELRRRIFGDPPLDDFDFTVDSAPPFQSEDEWFSGKVDNEHTQARTRATVQFLRDNAGKFPNEVG